MFCATALGLIVSITVTVAGAVATFPLASVTIRLTALLPTFEQLNVLDEPVPVQVA